MLHDRLVGLVVRRPSRERKIPGSNPACDRIFGGSSHNSDLKIGTPGVTLPGVIGSALGLIGPVSVCCDWVRYNFYLSVVACKIVSADPSLRYTRMLLGR